MATITLSKSIHIAKPRDVVFRAMTDWSHQSEWVAATVVTSYGGEGVGTNIVARTLVGPFGFDDTMTITKWEPPTLCAVRHTGKIIRGSGVFSVESSDDSSCVFVWSEYIELPFKVIGLIGWQVVRMPFYIGLLWSLRRFKKWVEGSTYSP